MQSPLLLWEKSDPAFIYRAAHTVSVSDIFHTHDDFSQMHIQDGLGSFSNVLDLRDLTLPIYVILWSFLGQANRGPFSEITAGSLWEGLLFVACTHAINIFYLQLADE